MPCVIEDFAVLQGVVVCRGYSDCGPPSLYHCGTEVATIYLSLQRPDLTPLHGPQSINWGFRLCALMPGVDPRHEDIVLQFRNGPIIGPPVYGFPDPSDEEYRTLLARFKLETARGGRILEIGSRARSGNVYRSWFDDSLHYTGLDIVAGPNVDVVGDAHHLSRHLDQKFDFALSVSVFEHLLMPWKVALELSKVMNIGGIGLIQSHAAFPLHEQPWDFWRYSRDAWKGIFNTHTGFEVLSTAHAGKAWTVPAFAIGGPAQGMDHAPSYLLSACLIRKCGDAKVAWESEAREVSEASYNHG